MKADNAQSYKEAPIAKHYFKSCKAINDNTKELVFILYICITLQLR